MASKYSITAFTQLYARKIQRLSDGSALFRLNLDRVHARMLRVLTHVAVENQTSGYTKCRLGIAKSGVDMYIDELITVAAGELAVSRSDILLGEGNVFFAELTGTTDGDVLVMSVIGWELGL